MELLQEKEIITASISLTMIYFVLCIFCGKRLYLWSTFQAQKTLISIIFYKLFFTVDFFMKNMIISNVIF